MVGMYIPGYTPTYTPWVHPSSSIPATVQAPRHREDSLAALRRRVAERTISDDALTDTRSLLVDVLTITRFTVGSVGLSPWAIPYGGGPLRRETASLRPSDR